MSRRVRVLHVITDAGPHRYFDLIGAHTDRERFDVRLATLGPRGPLHRAAEQMRLPAVALDARGRRSYPRVAATLAAHLRRARIDVLQAHLLDGCAVGLLAARLARTPLAILTAHHCHEIPLHDRIALTAVDRLCAGPLCDAIVAPSRQMRDTLVDFHGVAAPKVAVVPHGFELERLDPAVVAGDRLRAELGLQDRLVVGSIGRLYWVKNQHALVRAFARLAAVHDDAALLLVGAGDPHPILTLARSLGVGERVICLPPRDDVPELLAAIDLFAHPALAESFGMVIVEAMAMARPVVTTPVGIAPEMISDGETGFFAQDASDEGLAAALLRACSMRERWAAIGSAAREQALRLPADRMVGAYERLYSSAAPS